MCDHGYIEMELCPTCTTANALKDWNNTKPNEVVVKFPVEYHGTEKQLTRAVRRFEIYFALALLAWFVTIVVLILVLR